MKLNCYFKVTNACNMHCLHCYNYQAFKLTGNVKIKRSFIVKFLELLRPFLEEDNNTALIVFHGGEPLFYGYEFIKELCNVIREHLDLLNEKVELHIQSNLTINVNYGLVEVIKKYFDGMIGTSYDPYIRLLNGSFEKFKDRWEANVKFLMSEGIYIPVNIVLTRHFYENFNLFVDTISYLRSLGVSSFRLERFTPTGQGALNKSFLYLNDREFFELMIKILDFYAAFLEKGEVFYLNPLDDMLRFSGRGVGVSCWSGSCLFDTITLEPDGYLYPCPELRCRGIAPEGHIESVLNLYDLLYSRNRLYVLSKNHSLLKECSYFELCHRGCPSSPHDCLNTDGKCIEFFEKILLFSRYLKHLPDHT